MLAQPTAVSHTKRIGTMEREDVFLDGIGQLRSPISMFQESPANADEELYGLTTDPWNGQPPPHGILRTTSLPAPSLSGKRKQGQGSVSRGTSAGPRKKVAAAPLGRQLSAPAGHDRPRSGTQAGPSGSKEKGAQKKGYTRNPSSEETSSTKGGRPVTWFGGGGMNPQDLVGLGVPKLRALFLEIFGHHTASNNGAWLRRKLCEKPDAERGRGRSASIRKRDIGAAIWTTGAVKNITQAEAKVLVENGPVLANKTFIEVPDSATAAKDANSTAGTPADTPSVTPTRHLCKVRAVSKPTKLTYDFCDPDQTFVKAKRPLSDALDAATHGGASKVTHEDDAAIKPSLTGGMSLQPEGGPRMVRRLLQKHDLSNPGRFKGQQVEVYWPEDNTWWLARVIKLNSKQCQIVYETGETEDLQVDEVIRDGIMSIGWVPVNTRPESAGQLSVAGTPMKVSGIPSSPASVHIKQEGGSPCQSTPGLTPELRQLIHADVDVRTAASLDHSSDIDSGERFILDLTLQNVTSPASPQPEQINLPAMDVTRPACNLQQTPLDRDMQEWADNVLLTAKKLPPSAERHRSDSQESTASPHQLRILGSDGARAQERLKNVKITSAGKLHMAPHPGVHQQEGRRLNTQMPRPALEYRFGDCHQNIGGFLLDPEPLPMPPVAQQGPQPDFNGLDLANIWDCSVPDELLWNEPMGTLAAHNFPL